MTNATIKNTHHINDIQLVSFHQEDDCINVEFNVDNGKGGKIWYDGSLSMSMFENYLEQIYAETYRDATDSMEFDEYIDAHIEEMSEGDVFAFAIDILAANNSQTIIDFSKLAKHES